MASKKVGRPTDYTPEMADLICEQLSMGKSLKSALEAVEGSPSAATVFSWMGKIKEFPDKYARAKQEGTDAMAEDIMDISDESISDAYKADPKAAGAAVQAQRLRIDTRKWLMSKMKPKKYADHIDVTSGGQALPQPILNVIRNNDGSTKDIPAK